ncbi:MAG: hypothetical protein RBT71_06265 [Flavobacteriales bacterium]|jgi:hypothetical protein|nr:hypothetical protein [Flavobacteriales bacterium]
MPRWTAHPSLAWCLVALHLVFMGVLYHVQGVQADKEALKYLGAAADLLRGDASGLLGRYALYAGYILFLVPFVAVGMPLLAVGVQMLLGVAAAFALRRMVLRAGVPASVANGAMAVLLFAHPVQQWSLSLYSEGLFIPLVVLFMEQALHPRPQGWRLVLLGACVALVRPTGLLFVVPAVVLPGHGFFGWLPVRLRWWLAAAPMAGLLFAPALPPDQLAGIVQQHVVLGFPQRPDAAYDPAVRTLAQVQAEAIRVDGAAHWAWTLVRRAVALFNPMRPWFSHTHNLMVAPLLLLYPVALRGLWRTRGSAMGRTCLAVLAWNAMLVALTYAEWGGRFLAPLLPVVVLCAALGMPARAAMADRGTKKGAP